MTTRRVIILILASPGLFWDTVKFEGHIYPY